jgi:hypothetical protein
LNIGHIGVACSFYIVEDGSRPHWVAVALREIFQADPGERGG